MILWTLLSLTLASLSFAEPSSTAQIDPQQQEKRDYRIPTTLSLGFAPINITNDTFSSSATGMGLSIAGSVAPFNRLAQVIEVGYLSQAQTTPVDFIWAGYKYYFVGASQTAFRDGTSFSKARYRGVFVEVGPILYNLLSTDIETGESIGYFGMGATVQVGFEQPIFGKFFLSGRLAYMNAVMTASYYGIFALAHIGIPFNL